MISSPRQTTLSPNLDSTTQNKKCISDIMQEISYQSHNKQLGQWSHVSNM